MSGFLRRLASRTLGLSTPVRPISHLPFATAPALLEDITAGSDEGEERLVGRDVSIGTERGHEKASPAAPFAPVPKLPDLGATPPPQSAPARAFEGSSQLSPQSPPSGPRAREVAAIARPSEPRGDPPGSPARKVAFALTEVEVLVPKPGPVNGPRGNAPLRETPSQPPLEKADDRTAPDEGPLDRAFAVKPLVEAVHPPTPPAVLTVRPDRVPPPPAADRRVPPSAEAHDVHVTIGRIEVTAVHQAPAPRRSPVSRAKKPMSLDEYLAKRQADRR